MRLQVNSTWAYNRRVVSDTAGAPIDDTFNTLLQLRHFFGYEPQRYENDSGGPAMLDISYGFGYYFWQAKLVVNGRERLQ